MITLQHGKKNSENIIAHSAGVVEYTNCISAAG